MIFVIKYSDFTEFSALNQSLITEWTGFFHLLTLIFFLYIFTHLQIVLKSNNNNNNTKLHLCQYSIKQDIEIVQENIFLSKISKITSLWDSVAKQMKHENDKMRYFK